MHLYLGGYISQAFWRLVYPEGRKPITADVGDARKGWRDTRKGQCACTSGSITSMSPSWVKRCKEQGYDVVDVLVFDKSDVRKSNSTKTTLWSGRVPPRSFCAYSDDVSVSSPCFTFLQMARHLSLAELIAYGNELCGNYSFDGSKPRGMRQRTQPLTSVKELERYIHGASDVAGLKNARAALRYMVDASASPMETLSEMFLCLPYKLGGYKLDPPVMNSEIHLDSHAAGIAMQRTCFGDLCWPGLGLVLEYQGKYDHDDRDSFSSDRARINGLKAQGLNVIEVTGGIVHNLATFEEIALHIATLQGKRIPRYAMGSTPQRLELRSALFDWNARYGCTF